ncbi:hypothetical protein JRO89_XS01G0395900 [Xanthoceras sorbifolium]|uniref:Uncharacterized protein n=1 Tax=Xanthoceras sorbifolium TaxID=99658 RepID=A0ABQ8IPC4_9ROSI|nr:hypothetical protein JRO89_XS01G0395900 [Xanthoceras sorbifolium]
MSNHPWIFTFGIIDFEFEAAACVEFWRICIDPTSYAILGQRINKGQNCWLILCGIVCMCIHSAFKHCG